ncbi:unnamed protein product, partial [Cylicocyclus nassatus]
LKCRVPQRLCVSALVGTVESNCAALENVCSLRFRASNVDFRIQRWDNPRLHSDIGAQRCRPEENSEESVKERAIIEPPRMGPNFSILLCFCYFMLPAC